jgi:hypothetical protein
MKLEDDRIMRFLDACFDAGIKRPEAFILSKMPQVYGWLKGSFPRGILPTDIDGEVEINGHFLRMEFKHESAMRNGRIPKGQHTALKSLIKTGRFSVLLIGTNDGGEPTCFEVWHHNGKITALKDCTSADIYDLCSRWASFAESTP